jgi:ABC-type polysaccharide/polyol phosphate export permease
LLLLAVYALFSRPSSRRGRGGRRRIGFVPFLAVAFWPWSAFSESVLRASGTVTANAADRQGRLSQ